MKYDNKYINVSDLMANYINIKNNISFKIKSFKENELNTEYKIKNQLENDLIESCYKELENELSNFSENFSHENADYIVLNDIHGVDFHKDISTLWKNLENKYDTMILEKSMWRYTDNFCGYFDYQNKSYITSSHEDAFLFNYNNRHDDKLIFLENEYNIENDIHGIIKLESLFIEHGQCASLYRVGNYHCDITYIKNELPIFLKAFNSDDRQVSKRLDLILDTIELKELLNNYTYDLSELNELIFNELNISENYNAHDSEILDISIDYDLILKGKLKLFIESELYNEENEDYENKNFHIDINLENIK